MGKGPRFLKTLIRRLRRPDQLRGAAKDPAKNALNAERHGVLFAAAADFDWKTALVDIDGQHDYGETRFIATGCTCWLSTCVKHPCVSSAFARPTAGRSSTMQVTSKTGRKILLPTEAEDRAINEGIASDPDTMKLGDSFLAKAKPAAQVMRAKTVEAPETRTRPASGQRCSTNERKGESAAGPGCAGRVARNGSWVANPRQ